MESKEAFKERNDISPLANIIFPVAFGMVLVILPDRRNK
jgi:hypothetical protein